MDEKTGKCKENLKNNANNGTVFFVWNGITHFLVTGIK